MDAIKTYVPISFVMHYPASDKDLDELSRRVAELHADLVLSRVNKLNCPFTRKKELIDAIIVETALSIHS